MTKTLVIGLLATALLGMAPTATAVDCSGFNPGPPGGGAVGAAAWYALQNTYLACQAGNAVEGSATANAAILQGKALAVAGGALGLFSTGGLPGAASAYQSAALAATNSEAHDGCGAVAGDNNPACGPDPAVSQAQSCPTGVTVPNPIGGGLAGNTLSNSNGALQATCALANAAAGAAPTPGEATAYAGSAQATLLSMSGDVFDIGSDSLDAACMFAFGTVPCL